MSKKTLVQLTAELSEINDQIKQHIEDLQKMKDPIKVLTAFFILKDGYQALDAERKKTYHFVDFLDKNFIPAMFERLDTDKIQVRSLGKSFYPLTKNSASMYDKEKGFEWLKDHGLSELISETVNAGTLAKALKEYINEHGVEPDPEVIEFKTYQTTGISSYTPKD